MIQCIDCRTCSLFPWSPVLWLLGPDLLLSSRTTQKFSHLSPTINIYHSYNNMLLFTSTDLFSNSLNMVPASEEEKWLKNQYIIGILNGDYKIKVIMLKTEAGRWEEIRERDTILLRVIRKDLPNKVTFEERPEESDMQISVKRMFWA